MVSRPDLAARLDRPHRLTLVSAPAGYGKTATLAAWAEQHRGHLAWLSCDASDVEPTRFMSGLLSSIAARWPGAADDAFVLLERDGSSTHDAAVAVANELQRVDTTGVIVVDDLHLADPAPTLLSAFVDALPDGFRLVVGTRSDPPLSLARLRLGGDLLEVRSKDLCFGGSEVSAFLQLHDVGLAEDEVERVHGLTEGWPAGVQLAAIALQAGGGRGDFLEAFAGTDRSVGDFLLSEVLGRLPPDLVDFLVDTSVLDAFDAPLCMAMSGRDDAAAVLQRLVAADLFIVPLDARAHWYRYHHLFAAFLRAQLAARGGSRLALAHDRASRALEARGDVEGALRHAMAQPDVHRTGTILRAAIDRSMSLSEVSDVALRALRFWLHEAGAATIERDPQTLVELLIGMISLAGPDDVPAWLERVQRAHPDADGALAALIAGAWNEHHQHRGQPTEAIRHLRAAAAALGGRPPSTGMFPLLWAALARAHLQAGDLVQAARVLDDAMTHPSGSPLADGVRYPGVRAFTAALSGDLSLAQELATRAEECADQLDLGIHEPGRVFAGLARAEVLLERGQPDAARHVLDGVEVASEATHRLTVQHHVTLYLARVARIVGDEAGAEGQLAKARLAFARPDAAVRQVLGAEAAAQALRFEPSSAPVALDALDPEHPETRVLAARLALAEGDDRAAADLLTALPPASTRRRRVELGTLCALSLARSDPDRAQEHLSAALSEAQPEGLIRSVVDQGPEVHELLLAFVPSAAQQVHLRALVEASSQAVAPARRPAPIHLVEPLSDREVMVLRYLCSRMTYREIAGALYVSVNTLKTHVKSVYRKLEVTSRADAVDAARRVGVV